jgi:hypothetical protein
MGANYSLAGSRGCHESTRRLQRGCGEAGTFLASLEAGGWEEARVGPDARAWRGQGGKRARPRSARPWRFHTAFVLMPASLGAERARTGRVRVTRMPSVGSVEGSAAWKKAADMRRNRPTWRTLSSRAEQYCETLDACGQTIFHGKESETARPRQRRRRVPCEARNRTSWREHVPAGRTSCRQRPLDAPRSGLPLQELLADGFRIRRTEEPRARGPKEGVFFDSPQQKTRRLHCNSSIDARATTTGDRAPRTMHRTSSAGAAGCGIRQRPSRYQPAPSYPSE